MSNQQGPIQMRQYPGQPLPGSDGEYSIAPMFQNPAGTYPFPAPTGMPYTQWQSARTVLNWTNPGALDSGYITAGYWQSPLFDLRPEIKGADGSRPAGVPVWGAIGKKLWVQIDGLLSQSGGVSGTNELYMVSREYGNVFDAGQVQRISADADISAEVASGTNQPPSVILSFWPPGSGYPVRYWRLEIAFRRLDRLTFPFAVSAAMY